MPHISSTRSTTTSTTWACSREIDEETLTVDLVPCRFHSLLTDKPGVACRVHEQLLRSVLGRAGGPIVVDQVQPFLTPHSCRVHLALRPETADQGSVLPSSTPTNETPGVAR